MIKLGDLIDAKVSDVAALPVADHAAFQKEYAALQQRAKKIGATLDAALEMAYGGKNDTGTSHIEREGFDVKITVPKRVAWDREGLEVLTESNSDAAEYIDWEPSVAESRYKAAPDRVKELLDPYRTVKQGKVKFEITEKED